MTDPNDPSPAPDSAPKPDSAAVSNDPTQPPRWWRHWQQKFGHALRGLQRAVEGQSSFLVHLPVAALVVLAAAVLRLAMLEWAVLLLCITLVIALEMINTALETLVRRLHPDRDADVGKALDVAAGAVLVGAIGAVLVGLIVLGSAAWRWMIATG